MPTWLLPLLKYGGAAVGLGVTPSVINRVFGKTKTELARAAEKQSRRAGREESALQLLLSRGANSFTPEERFTPTLQKLAQAMALDQPSREEVLANTPSDVGEALLQQLGYPDRATFRAETGPPTPAVLQLLGMTDAEVELNDRYGPAGGRGVY